MARTNAGAVDDQIRAVNRIDAALTAEGQRAGVTVRLTGFAAYDRALVDTAQQQLRQAEAIGLPFVALVLLLMFGSFVALIVPLAIGVTGVVVALGIVGAIARVTDISDFVSNATVMIGLALGVDYAMFLLRRFRELAISGMECREALLTTMSTTGRAVAFSGLAVVLAEGALLLVDSRAVRSMAMGTMSATLSSLLAALVVTPCLISLLGRRLTRVPGW